MRVSLCTSPVYVCWGGGEGCLIIHACELFFTLLPSLVTASSGPPVILCHWVIITDVIMVALKRRVDATKFYAETVLQLPS